MTTGAKIRDARKRKNLTQKQLGDLCGIAEPTIRRYELGKLNPKYETLTRIAEALNVNPLELLDSGSMNYAVEFFRKGFLASKAAINAGETEVSVDGFTFSLEYDKEAVQNRNNLLSAFDQLNDEGQGKAVERVEELTEVPKYKKSPQD